METTSPKREALKLKIKELASEGKKPVAYTAGPDGFTEGTSFFMKERFLPIVRQFADVINPWEMSADLVPQIIANAMNPPLLHRLNTEIGRRNKEGIERSNLIIANLDGQEVDSGTASEIAYGVAKGKFAIGHRSDFRISGENFGCKVNHQVQYWVEDSGGRIVSSLEELKAELRDLTK